MAKDYYDILGISKDASQEEIKKAFRELAHKHHPDKAGGDEKKFKEINEAYQVLGNPEKRQQYDQFGKTFEQAQAQGGFSGFNGFRDFSGFQDAYRNSGQGFEFDFGDIGDIFGDFFGGRRGQRTKTQRTVRGSDIETEINLIFHEAAFGAEKTVELYKDIPCTQCGGSGNEPGSKIISCKACGGRGQVSHTIGFGIAFASSCSECGGSGQRNEKNCTQCHGRGVMKETEKIKIKIPAGINNGQTIKYKGRGEAGYMHGPSGDLYVTFTISPHQEFQRNDYDVLSKVAISIKQAALGCKKEIHTLDGNVVLKIPEGTQSGKVFRLRGQGVPKLKGFGRGDHLVEVIVNIPTKLTKKQRKLLEEFDTEENS